MPHVELAAGLDLSALVDQARAGGDVVLTQRGVPVARIVPEPASKPARVFGAFAHLTPPDADWSAVCSAVDEPLPEDELRLWEGRDSVNLGVGGRVDSADSLSSGVCPSPPPTTAT